MNDLCLQFDSSEHALQVLERFGLTVEGAPAPGVWLDVIGVITRPIGEPGPDGLQATEQLPGWHVNVLLAGEVPDALQPHVVTPQRRTRVWA